ncbi:MAG: NADH-quinone oxidoreductase subunit A [Anaerolineae bacterium]
MSGSLAAVLALGAVATALAVAVVAVSFLIGPHRPTPVKESTYESGVVPIGSALRRVPVRFYLVATLFILFDIEAVYLFPWAVRFRELARPAPVGIGADAVISMAVFLGVLFLGLVHVWRKGALRWD